MDQIRPWLFIGSYRDTRNLSYLKLSAIGAMLQLAEKVEHSNIVSLYIPVEDLAPISSDHIREGIGFIKEQKAKGNRILVACGAGINRSSAFSAAALKEEEGLTLFEAFKEVKQRHPESMPHQPVWESLCKYYNETALYFDVIRLSIQNL